MKHHREYCFYIHDTAQGAASIKRVEFLGEDGPMSRIRTAPGRKTTLVLSAAVWSTRRECLDVLCADAYREVRSAMTRVHAIKRHRAALLAARRALRKEA